ncbi:MAG: DUF2202 domain-containing protein [Acidobacteria bacterium]|nr:DUF2202 domain-containing protein [Acidobacteriota bacterium]
MSQGRAGFGGPQAKNRGNGLCVLTSTPLQDLDNAEITGLMHMREEEKIARDIYQTLYSTWGDRIFQRISQSEQQHMNAIGVLLDRYELEDPVAGNGVGEFSSAEMQTMYRDLVAMGQRSHIDALKVGAMIEDLDLFDLKEALALTDNDDITMVYENLMRGSQNHMRAFAGRLETLGESYAPRHISDRELAEILASGNASGAGSAGRGRRARQGMFGNGVRQRSGNTVTQ